MTNCMSARGPDAEAQWCGEGIVLGHRRLAILDLDARSNQPMRSGNGRYTIVFNGEIYNFYELRRGLETRGIPLRTTSDTEVLLELFALEGEAMLPRLRGMFAFAIWDSQLRELFLARDPYGIKPLYYTRRDGGLLFASQVNALLGSGLVANSPEPAGLAGFYLWGSVPEPWTLTRDVFALPAGHWMRIHEGVVSTPVSWQDIREHWRGECPKLSAMDLQEHVRQAVTASVRAHLVADVPICVFLSGGIDSSVLAGIVSEQGAKIQGITISFQEFEGKQEDEAPVAATLAAHFGISHHIHQVTCAEFEQDLPHILDAMDQPSIDGINTWFASKAAAARGYKVVLSGVGGDELFCGYPSFQLIPRMAVLGQVAGAIPGLRSLLREPCAWLGRRSSNPKIVGLPAFMDSVEGLYFLKRGLFLPDELPELMGVDWACEGLARLGGAPPGMAQAKAYDGASNIGLLESTHYLRNQLLRDSDWASMAHSLELRTPLVDATLLATLGPHVSAFAGGIGKAMLAKSPEKPLPGFIINRQKTGFSIPMAQWLSDVSDRHSMANLPLLASRRTPWARRWARVVMERHLGCG
jgi:asparagine synthase (glutamine-hydrolysing)